MLHLLQRSTRKSCKTSWFVFNENASSKVIRPGKHAHCAKASEQQKDVIKQATSKYQDSLFWNEQCTVTRSEHHSQKSVPTDVSQRFGMQLELQG